MFKDEGKVPSSMVKQILNTQFPANKNVINRDVYWTKKRIQALLPRMNDCDTFQDFKSIYKASKLHIGIDDIPPSNDNIAQIGKDLLLEIMNDYNCQDSMITFKEYMLNLQDQNERFAVTF